MRNRWRGYLPVIARPPFWDSTRAAKELGVSEAKLLAFVRVKDCPAAFESLKGRLQFYPEGLRMWAEDFPAIIEKLR